MSRWQEAQWHSGIVWHVGVPTGGSSLCSMKFSWSSSQLILYSQSLKFNISPSHTAFSWGSSHHCWYHSTLKCHLKCKKKWVKCLWVLYQNECTCLDWVHIYSVDCDPWKTLFGKWWWERKSFVPVKGTLKLTGNSKTFIFQWSKLINPRFWGCCLKKIKPNCQYWADFSICQECY